jgi:hypothetical protein
MKKVQLLGVGLIALLALGVFTASASATFLLAEWLVGGAAVTTELTSETSGELLLEDTKVPIIGHATVLCSGIFAGWVGPNSLDWVSEVLNAAKEAISTTPLTGLALSCTAQSGCETNTTVSVYPVGLPWVSETELLEQETPVLTFFADLTKSANGTALGWEITNCLVIGSAMEDECTTSEGSSEFSLENTTTLLGAFSTIFTGLSGLSLASCKEGGAGSGVVEGSGPITLTAGGTLSVSSEGVEP